MPSYEEVIDRPATPPPPYTPVQSAPLSMELPEEASSPHLSISFSSDPNVALSATPDSTQTYSHSGFSPNKDLMPGRYRRFTGDSGIEVCDAQELWELHGILQREEETEEEGARQVEDPCDPCYPQILEHNHICVAVSDENTARPAAVDADPQSDR